MPDAAPPSGHPFALIARETMEELGNMLIRLGPTFAVVFFVLVVGSALAMLGISIATLWREGRHAHAHHGSALPT